MAFKISKIQHVGIPVTDLKKSVEFYKQLGFTQALKSQFDHNSEQGNVIMMQSGEVIMVFVFDFFAQAESSKSAIKLHIILVTNDGMAL